MKSISIYSEHYPESWVRSTGGAIRDDHPRLDVELAQKLVIYLDEAAVVLATTGRIADKFDLSKGSVVNISIFTDGVYYWDDSFRYYIHTYYIHTYYIHTYHLSPGEEFINHCERRRFKMNVVADETIDPIRQQLLS